MGKNALKFNLQLLSTDGLAGKIGNNTSWYTQTFLLRGKITGIPNYAIFIEGKAILLKPPKYLTLLSFSIQGFLV